MTYHRTFSQIVLTVASVLIAAILGTPSSAADQDPCPATTLAWLDKVFANEVWPKVGGAECLKCHKQAGDAEDTRLVLQDLSRSTESERAGVMRLNRDAFVRMALQKADNQPLLLVKATGGLDHGGEEVLKKDSTGYRILEDFVRRVTIPHSVPSDEPIVDQSERPFFEGVVMLTHRKLLRRATLSLVLDQAKLESDFV